MTRPTDKRLTKSKVNSPPRGLQSLLGNVNQGINPHELDHEISPIVDLYPFWSVDKLEFINFQSTFASAFQLHSLTVPATELWLINSLSGEALMNVGESIAMSIGVRTRTGLDIALGMSATVTAVAASEVQTASVVFGMPYVLRPGEGIYIRSNVFNAAAGRACALRAQYVKLAI